MKTLQFLRTDLRRKVKIDALFNDIRFYLTQGDYTEANRHALKLYRLTGVNYVISDTE